MGTGGANLWCNYGMFLARVKQDITHYLPMALAREELRITISRSPELGAFPLGSTRHSLGRSTGSGACTPAAPTGNSMRGTWDAAPRGGSGQLGGRDTGGGWEGPRAAGDRKVNSIARGEPRGSEMGQHMPYKKADTQTEQKRC